MSVQAISWALSVEAGSPSAKCTLLCIANYADDRGRCWPSQATIAKQSEQSVDTIQRRIKDLERAGLLSRVERPEQNGKAGGRYFYQLSMINQSSIQDVETIPQSAARSKTTPQIAENHAAKSQKPCRTVAAQTAILEPSFLEPSEGIPPSDWPSNYFDQFWERYPPGRKTEKRAVIEKLDRIKRDGEVTFSVLIAGVVRYADSRPEPKYTKAPLVWLNRGCWDDEIEPPKPERMSMFDIATGNHGAQNR